MSDYGINIGSRRSRNVITPTFSRDFITNNTLNHGVGPNITFTRASSATFFTSTGILSTVPNNVPRFDHGNFRTNYIWNSTFAGAVAGNPGTPPSNGWGFQHDNKGISYIIKSVGNDTELGLPYMEVQLSGTNTSGTVAHLAIYPAIPTHIPVLSGQTWTTSVYFKTIVGTLPQQPSLYNFELGEPGPIGTSTTSFTPTTNWQRITNTRTMSITSSPRYLRPAFALPSVENGGSIDYTFRIAAPQTELSSVATAFIPTTNAPATTGIPLGLLIELPRANLYQRSEEFDNEYWTKARATITTPDALLSPAGTTTADLLVEDNTVNNSHIVFRQVSYTGYGANGPVTATIFAKAKERTRLSLVVGYGTTTPVNLSFGEVVFNLIDGTAGSFVGYPFGTAGPGTGSGTIIPAGNGWYRCSITVTPSNVTATEIQLYVALHNGTSTSYTGDGTSGLYIWGAQLEVGSFPTSYIPTTTLSAIRQADVAQINPVTSFVNQSQGTLFSEFRTGTGFPVAAAFVLDADAIGDRVGIFASGATQVAINNVFTSIAGFSPFTNTIFKAALGYKAFNHASSINGQTVQGNTAIGVPINLSYLRIGCEGGSGFTDGQLSGHVRKVTYWPTKLSNNRLRLITS